MNEIINSTAGAQFGAAPWLGVIPIADQIGNVVTCAHHSHMLAATGHATAPETGASLVAKLQPLVSLLQAECNHLLKQSLSLEPA